MKSAEIYQLRFSRNIGILTPLEQKKLGETCVGVAGLGGLGGQTFINLVRMGIGKFIIADLDTFDIANTNRQIGAMKSTYGLSKVEVMSRMAKDINPDVEIEEFHQGIQKDSVDAFVKNSDIVVDSLDFFCLTPRRWLYSACEKQEKTFILSAPLGLSATLHAFSKNSMKSDTYFGWKEGQDLFEQMLHFAVGIAPSGLHLKYLNFDKHKLATAGTGPSLSVACGLGASLLAAEIMFALLERRPLFQAPYFTQFDLLRGKYVRERLLWGNNNPLQKLKIYFARKEYQEVRTQLLQHIK